MIIKYFIRLATICVIWQKYHLKNLTSCRPVHPSPKMAYLKPQSSMLPTPTPKRKYLALIELVDNKVISTQQLCTFLKHSIRFKWSNCHKAMFKVLMTSHFFWKILTISWWKWSCKSPNYFWRGLSKKLLLLLSL